MTNIVLSDRPTVGVTLVANLYNIADRDLLCFLWRGIAALNDVVGRLDLNVVGETCFQFEPFGYTIAYALSESHITIHTYPEHNSCYIDIFCCNPHFNPDNALNVLKTIFNTNMITHHIIRR